MKIVNLNGVGLGLRAEHYRYIHDFQPPVPWFEVLADNYLMSGGSCLVHLDKICEHYPITFHCVGMSLGSTDPLNKEYFHKLKKIIKRFQPALISDHLSWTSLEGRYFHELLPLPYTEEAIKHVSNRIMQVQEILEQQIMIENVSNYLSYKHSTIKEWEFLQEIADRADCYILLDINNIYVSSFNNQFAPLEFIQGLSPERVLQFHLGGYEDKEFYLFDTHSKPISNDVWCLFQEAIKRFGPLITSIERDHNIPPFSDLYQESREAAKILMSYKKLLSC